MTDLPSRGAPRPWRVRATAAFALAAVALGSFLAAAPLAAWRLKRAADAGDTAAVARLVDVPALRASLKNVYRARLEPARREPRLARRLAGRAQRLVGGTLADPVIDRSVTPENLARLLRGDGPSTPPPRVSMRYESLRRFVVTAEPAGGDPVRLVFERYGPFRWKLSGVRLG